MNKKTFDRIAIMTFFILIITNFMLAYWVFTKKEAFFENPLTYGASQISEEAQCTCRFSNTLGEQKIVKFNSTSMWYEDRGLLLP